jgi:HrpA-like RNA helicase
VKPISKDSAIQRAGRSGREQEGKCFRIYTQKDHEKLNQHNIPVIL